MPSAQQRFVNRLHTVGRAFVVVSLSLFLLHTLVLAAVTPRPSAVYASPRSPHRSMGVRRLDRSWVRSRGGMLQVHLEGTPEAIGAAHVALLYDEMVDNERALWTFFRATVPSRMVRSALVDLSRIRYAGLSSSLEYGRRAELGAAAQAFRPDPLRDSVPTYARFLLLNALYDVSLAFEHSPMIGCSSVFLAGDAAAGGALLGRNFDFETHEVFDRGKAVILFAESGKVPVVSVAWPGLAGVVTGMNANGVAAIVHGARAGSPSTSGQPVLLTLREALANARSAEDVASWLKERDAMVSHIVLVADGHGHSLVVERIPRQRAHVRVGAQRLALTNHLEGPGAWDPADQRVREQTSTLSRRRRLDVLVRSRSFTPRDVASVLRDRRDAEGRRLPDGDRRAIDADIATHGVVMDLKNRVIWVSQGPHLSGQFVRFDVRAWVKDPQRESMRRGWEGL